MNTLKGLREDLQAALTGTGLQVLSHLPERITPPLSIVAAGSPYVEGGESFGSYTVRLTVVLVAPQGTNETVTHTLDALVAQALVALDASGWGLERVDTPMMLSHGGTHFLSTQIDVLRRVDGMDDGRAD